jgi:hypothetical protein
MSPAAPPGDDEARARERARALEPTIPNIARVYNYWLGGKDNYAADREAARKVAADRPEVVAASLANRAYHSRVVRFLAAECGIRQFLDVGTGLPAPQNTHEVAQRVAPESLVVYVDNDPNVLAHAQALMRGNCDYVDSDLRDTARVLAGAHTLDLTRPVGLLFLAVLQFIPDTDDPAGLVASLAAALAPGSYVAISHMTTELGPGAVSTAVQSYNSQVSVPLNPRTRDEVTGLLGGLALVPPGVVQIEQWRPDIPLEAPDLPPEVTYLPGRAGLRADMYAAVSRLP